MALTQVALATNIWAFPSEHSITFSRWRLIEISAIASIKNDKKT